MLRSEVLLLRVVSPPYITAELWDKEIGLNLAFILTAFGSFSIISAKSGCVSILDIRFSILDVRQALRIEHRMSRLYGEIHNETKSHHP